MKRSVLEGQSLWDIALQVTGDIAGAWELAEHLGICLTEELETGSELELPETVKNRQLAAYYAQRDIRPATALAMDAAAGSDGLLPQGINFWGIEYDFKVN